MLLETILLDPLIDIRAVHFAMTILATGTVFFRFLVADLTFRTEGDNSLLAVQTLRRRLSCLIFCGLFGVVLSAIAWLVLLTANIYGTSIADVCVNGGIGKVLTDTRFGQISIVRVVLAILLAVNAGWTESTAAHAGRRFVPAILAIGLLTSLAWIGHAGATPGAAGQFHLAADALHLMAAGLWIGGLPPLAMLLACARRSKTPGCAGIITTAVRRFSLLGIVCVSGLLATGIVNTVSLVGSIDSLLRTDYGQLLLMKIGLFVAIIGIAAVNRFHLTPRLAMADAIGHLQRNSLAETALALAILVFVSALGTMPPASHSHHNGSYAATAVPAGAAFVHIHSEKGMAEVTILPRRPGTSDASIRLLASDLGPLAAQRVTITLIGPAASDKPTTRIAARVADGKWEVGKIALPRPGIWTVVVGIALNTSDRLVLEGTIVITR